MPSSLSSLCVDFCPVSSPPPPPPSSSSAGDDPRTGKSQFRPRSSSYAVQSSLAVSWAVAGRAGGTRRSILVKRCTANVRRRQQRDSSSPCASPILEPRATKRRRQRRRDPDTIHTNRKHKSIKDSLRFLDRTVTDHRQPIRMYSPPPPPPASLSSSSFLRLLRSLTMRKGSGNEKKGEGERKGEKRKRGKKG